MSAPSKPRVAFVSQSIRKDIHAPLQKLKKDWIIRHFYLDAPYGDFDPKDFNDAEQVTFKTLGRALQTFRPNIVQGVEPFGSRAGLRLSFQVTRAARRLGVPQLIVVMENQPLSARFGALLGPGLGLFARWLNRHTALFIAANKGARRNLEQIGVRKDKIVNFPHGVWGFDDHHFRPAPLKRSPVPTLIFVGRMVEEKGPLEAIYIYERLKERIPELEMIVVGDGPLYDAARLKITSIPNSAITLHRKLPQSALPALFQQAWVTVAPTITMPKWAEQVGIVNIQSMACGTPVAAYSSGAIPEYVPNGIGGILVPEGKTAMLQNAVKKILTDAQLRHKLSNLSARYAYAHYRPAESMRALSGIFNKLLER